MTLFLRVLQFLAALIILRFVLRALFGGRMARRGPANANAGRGPKPVERLGGTLVRCQQCGTHVPQSKVVTATAGAQTHSFCSTACRDAHLAAERRAG